MMAARTEGRLLEVSGLTVAFEVDGRSLEAVHDVSFRLERGRTLAVLGESGSGKSATALALMGLLGPRARVSGRILLDGADLLGLSQAELRRIRGRRIAMVFQDALDALNPVHTVGSQIAEAVGAHGRVGRAEARARAVELMERVALPSARARFHDFPHQFSGGMRQRIMIAMALALEPELLIADEPTTALDVTVQAQILNLLGEIQDESKMALLLITHDLGVAADLADDIAVMYAGRIVEVGATAGVYREPSHPYTAALLSSAPRLARVGTRLPAIVGTPPSLAHRPSGCAFHPRCAIAERRCAVERPRLRRTRSGAVAACHLAEDADA
jgi:oligopeptide/dipeptide ABC transporter ATP-binding protein